MTGHPFRTEDIEGAERIFGASYTLQERQQMLDNLEGQIASARLRRTVRLDNDEPMATRFDPRLPNFTMPAPEGPLRFSAQGGGGAAGRR